MGKDENNRAGALELFDRLGSPSLRGGDYQGGLKREHSLGREAAVVGDLGQPVRFIRKGAGSIDADHALPGAEGGPDGIQGALEGELRQPLQPFSLPARTPTW